ncbi:MAG: hypothetical protein EZS28_031068 [Streblomastix strix]|uniref:Uncharacterized protein n=1 Tax=Streblomastix strix TaxID=222440 RepID=A0A5J4UUI5_9EUKA|nr:MAG: hypothetical protein EZS28_031068 [Streblomastix strix]
MLSFQLRLFSVNLLVFHLRIQVLKPDSIAIVSALVFQKLDQKVEWPTELGADEVNKLDYSVYYNPKVGEFYMNQRRPSVTLRYLHNYMLQNEEGTCQISEMVIISMVLVSVVLNKIAIQSRLMYTSPTVESIFQVPSHLLSIGLLADQLSPDFLILVQISKHVMVKLRVR